MAASRSRRSFEVAPGEQGGPVGAERGLDRRGREYLIRVLFQGARILLSELRRAEDAPLLVEPIRIHVGILRHREFDRVQPVWLQPSCARKPLRYRGEALARRIGSGPEGRPRGHYSPLGLKGDAQGTYP